MPIQRRQFLAGTAALLGSAPLHSAVGQTTDAYADLVVLDGRITTMDPNRPEATALAARDGKFIKIGDEADVTPLIGPFTQVVRANKKRIIPGLIDSHTHSIRGGVNYNLEVRWDHADSLEEALHLLRIQAERTPEGQFIRVAGGFSEFQFKEKRLPTVAELDSVAPNHPVLIHYLYKMTLLNSRAISYFGYDKEGHPTYPGGVIEKDANGDPTGRLISAPSGLLMYKTLSQAPKLSIRDQINSSMQYMDELNSMGITSVSDAGGGGMEFPDADPYQVINHMHREGLLTTRIGYHTFPQVKGREFEDYQDWTDRFTPGEGDDMLRLIGAGENLSWASYDFEIFGEERPDIDRNAEEIQHKIMTLLGEKGWAFRQHITYDETGDRLLKVYEDVKRGAGLVDGWFVDHVETFSERNLERIAELGGGVALQNRLQFQAEDFVKTYGMEKLKKTPNFRFIMDLGIPMGGGTDATRVTSYNPWYSIQWMATGLSRGGMRMYDDDNLLTREEALRVWTVGSSWFTGDSGKKGAITEGQLADFAILDRDYFAVTDAEIARITSALTAVGGRVVYAKDEFATHDLSHVPPVSPNWSPVVTFGDSRDAK
ncbi:amidohydrolase [Pseudovibrio exalbescens]|uniref:amidohydrolase n=1 Tax=Pseudovibrio exalbescens TaxID=197461 RepID=UPI0023668F14|nr:amidohydrolase [Pseudovibrio exalbescens]MDD7910920.1 amidohydrolase [Pseudovibrio exalbescens]